MPSSTSRFSWLPAKSLLIVATAVATLVLCGIYTCDLNPENQGIKYAYAAKNRFCDQLDRDPAPKMIFVGGSSCAHQIDTTLLNDQFKLRSVNMGHFAGIGLVVNTAIGMAHARPGDALVLAIEPETLGDTGITQVGYQYLSATDSSRVRHVLQELRTGYSYANQINALRPGLYHLVTHAGKLLLHQRLDQFDPANLLPDGFEMENSRKQFAGMDPGLQKISPQAKEFLQHVADWGRRNNVRVAYLMPWGFYRPGAEDKARENNRRLLGEIGELVPVLRDDKFGVWTQRADFSDTELHLTSAAAAARTAYLAPTLQAWRLFSTRELADVSP